MSLLRLLLCLLALVCTTLANDLYDVLGVGRDADDGQIKKAFRKLSLQYHPDKNQGDPAALKKFEEISHAYDILSNPEQRQIYDLYGEEGLKNGGQRQQTGTIFDLFGGGQPGQRKGPDYRMDLPVTLEELYTGGQRVVNIKRKVLCKSCRGTGAKDGAQTVCNVCKGQGQVIALQQLAPGFNIQTQMPCNACGGRGKIPKAPCNVCGGSKQVMEEKPLDIVVERGAPDGEELRFERMSEQTPDAIPGDVVFVLRQQSHPRFRRDGDNLHIDLTISLRDALLGFSTQITHLDNHMVKLDQKTVTSHGQPLVHTLSHLTTCI